MDGLPSADLSPRALLRWGQLLRDYFPASALRWDGLTDDAVARQLIAASDAALAEKQAPAVSVWFFRGESDSLRLAEAVERSALLVVSLDAGTEAALESLAAELTERKVLRDFAVDFSAFPLPVICFRAAADFELSTYAAAAWTAVHRLEKRNAEAETRLALRLAELDDAQKRLEEWQARYELALAKTHENRDKKNYWRDRCKRLESSRELRWGHAVLAPILSLQRTGARLKKSFRKRLAGKHQPSVYHQWRARLREEKTGLAEITSRMAALSVRPKLRLVTFAPDADKPAWQKTLNTLAEQTYTDWRWLIAAKPEVSALIEPMVKRMPKLQGRVEFIPATESAVNKDLGDADFVATLAPGDEMEATALAEIALALAEDSATDVLYADEDRVNERGWLDDPFFKPQWSPDTFLAGNYLGRLTFVRRSLIEQVGGWRADFGTASDYDLLLRATEQTTQIRHLPRVLGHFPATDLSNDADTRNALEATLARRNQPGSVTRQNGFWRVRYEVREPQKITILIPTRDRLELLERCARSIETRTDYPRYEIVIIDNDSQEDATFDYYRTTPHRVVHYEGQFNFSAMNNYAVAQTDGEWLLLLNNDMEVLHADWLSLLAGHGQRPEVGAVGAQLAYPDGTIQHAGVPIGVMGVGAHAFRGLPVEAPGVRGQLQMTRNYSAVTGACLLTRREVYQQVGGLDERMFPVNFNDIDYCLKVRALGLSVIYEPAVKLIHYESASRGRRYENLLSVRAFLEKWADVVANDPFYHPVLTKKAEDFSWDEMAADSPTP